MPVFDGVEQEFVQCDPIRTDQQAAAGVERLGKGCQSRARLPRSPTLHINRNQPSAGPQHEVHLPVAVPRLEQLAHPHWGGIRQVRSHGRLNQPSPELGVAAGFTKGHSRLGGKQRVIQHLQLGA
jgi:hypothetical protein